MQGQLRELNALAVALVGAGDASERQALLAQAEAAASLLTTASTGTGGQDKDKVHAEYYVKVRYYGPAGRKGKQNRPGQATID